MFKDLQPVLGFEPPAQLRSAFPAPFSKPLGDLLLDLRLVFEKTPLAVARPWLVAREQRLESAVARELEPVKNPAQATAAQLRNLISMMLAFAGQLDAQQPGFLPASFCLGIAQGDLVGQIRSF